MAEIAEEIDRTEEPGLQVRLRVPAKMPSVVAHHLAVQPNEDGVLLTFFEVIPPIMPVNATEEQMSQLKAAGVVAEAVAKVFIPGSRYEPLIKAMLSVLPEEGEMLDEAPEEVEQ